MKRLRSRSTRRRGKSPKKPASVSNLPANCLLGDLTYAWNLGNTGLTLSWRWGTKHLKHLQREFLGSRIIEAQYSPVGRELTVRFSPPSIPPTSSEDNT